MAEEPTEPIVKQPDGGGVVPKTDEAKVEFEPNQQEKVQALIDDAYKKAYNKAESKSEEAISNLTSTINKLKQDMETSNKKPVAKVDPTDEQQKVIDGLNEQLETINTQVAEEKKAVNKEKKMNALYASVGKHSVINPEDVVTLLQSKIAVNDEGNVYVQGDGSPKLNKHGEPISLDDFVMEWLGQRPNFLRGTGGGGGSSSSTIGGKVTKDYSNPETIRNMPQEEFQKLMNDGITITNHRGTEFKFKDPKNKYQDARRAKYQKTKR